MKEIKLIPDAPFYNSVDVHVMDFPHGRDGEERQRCKITVEFAKTDVDDLRKRGMGLTEAMEYYRGWIYDIVKVHISQHKRHGRDTCHSRGACEDLFLTGLNFEQTGKTVHI